MLWKKGNLYAPTNRTKHYIEYNSPRNFYFILFNKHFLFGCERMRTATSPVDSVTTIKIGFIYSPPDPGTTRNGAELAVAIANEAGGINGLPIELLIRDDKRDPELSVQHASELVAEGVLTVIGPDYSVLALDAAPVLQQHGIPMVTTYPTNPKVPESGNYIFMAAFIDPYQAAVMANFAIQELEPMTAAVLTETGSAYSEGLSNTFIQDFTAQGGRLLIQQVYEQVPRFTQSVGDRCCEPALILLFGRVWVPKFPCAS